MRNFNIKKISLMLPVFAIMTAFILNGCSNDTTTTTGTTKTYNQVDQQGRPAINTVFVGASDSLQKNTFNVTVPSQMQSAFLSTFTGRLLALNAGYTTNLLTLDANTFCTVLVNDVLTVSKVGPTTFYDGTHVLTGRKLDDDVIDVELILIFGGPAGTQNPGLTSDHVNSNDASFSSTFPYLAIPH